MVRLIAKAKINVGLNILNYYPEYKKHKIKSIFVLIDDYYDEIYVSNCQSANSVSYFKDNQEIKMENDIVLKAINFMKQRFNISDFFQVVVYKNIPMGAGLGGSSSDAGCLIKYLVKKYKITLTRKDYLDIAIELGSDICFFITGYELALVSEFGNKIKQIKKDKPTYRIIANNFESSTSEIYSIFRQYGERTENNYKKLIKLLPSVDINELYNDLQNCAFLANNNLLSFYKDISQYSKVILSGSGSYFVKFN